MFALLHGKLKDGRRCDASFDHSNIRLPAHPSSTEQNFIILSSSSSSSRSGPLRKGDKGRKRRPRAAARLQQTVHACRWSRSRWSRRRVARRLFSVNSAAFKLYTAGGNKQRYAKLGKTALLRAGATEASLDICVEDDSFTGLDRVPQAPPVFLVFKQLNLQRLQR